MQNIEKACYLLIGSFVFSAFGWGVKNHFRSDKMPVGMLVISISSLIAFFVYVYVFAYNSVNFFSATSGAILQTIAAAIFFSAVQQTKQRRLSLAYDEDKPSFIVASGPYSLVRHPFYLSYIIYWTGCSIASRSLIVSAAAAFMFALYLLAAVKEERKFERSDLHGEYRNYKRKAGLFWPKLGQAR